MGDEEEDDEEEATEESKVDTKWCVIEDKELEGYATGKRVAMEDLKQAKSACGAMAGCTGLTTELGAYTLRSGSDLTDSPGSTTFLPGECPDPAVCTWEKVDNKKLKGALTKRTISLEKQSRRVRKERIVRASLANLLRNVHW